MPQDSDIQGFVQAAKEKYSNWTQIYGGYGPVGVGDLRESTLDFEYIMTVGRGGNYFESILATFLTAMHSSKLVDVH